MGIGETPGGESLAHGGHRGAPVSSAQCAARTTGVMGGNCFSGDVGLDGRGPGAEIDDRDRLASRRNQIAQIGDFLALGVASARHMDRSHPCLSLKGSEAR